MIPENKLSVSLRLLDFKHEVSEDFGKYENLLLSDISIKQLMKELNATYVKAMKQLEIDLTNFKKGV
jgi:hypothetical protein